MIEQPPSWSYPERAKALLNRAGSLLDLGTGDGALLASLAPLPTRTTATETYPPNVPIARRRLEPLGVDVVEVDNGGLPFEADGFDVILSRHQTFEASELRRMLTRRGRLLTQQVGCRNLEELNETLGSPACAPEWDLTMAVRALEAAGFEIVVAQEAFLPTVFTDIGAVVYYLRAVPWQIEGFDTVRFRDRLFDLHEAIELDGGFTAHAHRFLVEAVRRT
jgi:SAM-dependent methyltransferase